MEEKQSEDGGSCGCEEACSRGATYTYTQTCTVNFTRLKKGGPVYLVELNHILEERYETFWNPIVADVDVSLFQHAVLKIIQINTYGFICFTTCGALNVRFNAVKICIYIFSFLPFNVYPLSHLAVCAFPSPSNKVKTHLAWYILIRISQNGISFHAAGRTLV